MCEVATFRADAPYTDGRRPSAVRFGTIEEDAVRRDFTIGGMYYDPIAERLIDLVGGMRDLRAGIVRAIGNPYDRFEEDHLRILRAARFAARLNFAIDPATWTAMKRAAPLIAAIAAERIGEELVMLMTEGGAARGMDLMMESGLMQILLPEAVAMTGCAQPENFHPEGDVYTHTRMAVAMLPEDAAKPSRSESSCTISPSPAAVRSPATRSPFTVIPTWAPRWRRRSWRGSSAHAWSRSAWPIW